MASITPSTIYNDRKNGKLMAVIATISIILDVFFATPLLTIVWLGIGLWFCAGLKADTEKFQIILNLFLGMFLFCRCDCCTCDDLCDKEYERVGLNTSISDCSLPEINLYKEKYIDAIYIQR